ncbi:apoptosis regulator BAX-like protein [Labeo rohita]|uniref:Apoptosis regulator BAX-like protein n=1 Tax=Labeo rohita TaxID=84645 RepID=A0A498NNV0_LABRO|nr:apoptosis regulator BAX-like protein [Labeo rohita]
MACEVSQDDQIGEALLIGVVRNEVMSVTAEVHAAPPALPEARPISNSQDQKLVEQLAETIKVIGDRLDQDKAFNDMIDGLVKVADKKSFWELVEKVFTDGQINWGRIIVLFYSVGKLSAKMVLASLPTIVSDILTLCLDYFRRTLLEWIRKMGGWWSSNPIAGPRRKKTEKAVMELDYQFSENLVLRMVDGFARVADRQSFQMLVNKVFVDDITWGKIVTLICVVGKSIAKDKSVIVTFKYLQINSISSLARYSFERDFGTSSSLTSLSCGVFFISGLLLGGLIVWRLNRSA